MDNPGDKSKAPPAGTVNGAPAVEPVDQGRLHVIRENLREVNARIREAELKAGRDAGSVRLIAVSKTKPLELIRAAIACGQQSFGENYVQEAIGKVDAIPEVDWHFIGALQSNKAKQVAGRFALIHSVDRARLVTELGRAAAAKGIVQDVLLQVHVGDELTKSGATFTEAPRLIEQILSESGLRLRGIMSLPPLTDDEAEARGYFSSLRQAFERWRSSELSPGQATAFTELSMGTSGDFEWAVLEGATCVRVGTSIFGARERKAETR